MIVATRETTGSTHHPAPAPAGVAVVGDSITLMLRSEIPVDFDGRYRADLRAVVGARIDEMAGTLADALRRNPRDVVVNLGTNDAVQAETHPNWQPGFAALIAALAPVHCVVLVNLNAELAHRPVVERVARDINRALARAADDHPNMHVLGWNAMLRAPGGAGLLVSDAIHPTAEGQLELAAAIRRALDTDCPG